jgi:ATPase subunit of ABC transporter with duplicated ATPase domains
MIACHGVTLQFGKRRLFEDVHINFAPGNCYGVIGANGSGKSTFLKILSGDIESTAGSVIIDKNKRLSILKQDQFAYDTYPVLTTVIMGHKRLYEIMTEKDAIYAKPDFNDEDGLRASDLETEFSELNGWDAESEAAKLLSDLGIPEDLHQSPMKQLEAGQKVRVLLAQALFGNPDILLLDEPTNHLDVETVMWLEDFLYNFDNTAIVVSHDRHFLDRVCTRIADIDFGRIQLYPGNYSFWKESSELLIRQKQDANKKVEEKKKELQSFIARFSANASKSRQATSRRKILENLNLEEIKPSLRKYPYIDFKPSREAGNDILEIHALSKTIDGKPMFRDLTLHVNKGDKIAFMGRYDLAKTILFQILAGEASADSGSFKWGKTIVLSCFPKDHAKYFETDLNLIDWLRQFSEEREENFIRGFLGRMLFSGEESLKSVKVLSGGEKVRCLLSRMMLAGGNFLILDEPTNHLDLESISALNTALEKFPGAVLFSSHDHQFVQTVANRIVELTPYGIIDRQQTTLDEYLADESLKKQREALYQKDSVSMTS